MKSLLRFCLLVICNIAVADSQTFDVLKYDWRARADSLWGTVPAAEELQVFDSVWTLIDQKFACFQNLDLDWNGLKTKYRPEIEKGVSRGRFAAILSQMSLALKEPHTRIGDAGISNLVRGTPGVPMLFSGGLGNDGSFGAGLTPLEDSTVLVYKAIPSHPLGLVPGDIVLGYDGVPWKQLYPQLMKMELPISLSSYWGANESSFTHAWLQSAGRNWHLFDTIDILKYETKDTLHLPTSLLIGKDLSLFCTEQLPVAGVPIADSAIQTKDMLWGIVHGTNIGYIYSWSWFSSDGHFRNAIDSLTRIYKVDGIVIDVRCNNGGYMTNVDQGLSLLFNVAPPPIYLGRRDDPLDHSSMTSYETFSFNVDSTRFFDKPIAVLMGPSSVSANDFMATQLRHHPKARFFGKPPASGYASDLIVSIDSICVAQYAWLNGYVLEAGLPHYLTHVEFQMDEKVWFTPDGVAKGEDDVSKAALAWIASVTNVDSRMIAGIPGAIVLNQNYPNPFNPSTKIQFTIVNRQLTIVRVFDLLGREVSTLVNEVKEPGTYTVEFNASSLASGVYFYRLSAGQYVECRKMLVMK
jgi:Peptidase family S41/Secretion system C-terminal sorting domain/Tricorn protease C1 domain